MHLTTPGPIGPGGAVASRRSCGCRWSAASTPISPAYTALLSGSPRSAADARVHALALRRCAAGARAVRGTRRALLVARASTARAHRGLAARRRHRAVLARPAVGGAARAVARVGRAAGDSLCRPACRGRKDSICCRRCSAPARAGRRAPPRRRRRRADAPRAGATRCPTPCSSARSAASDVAEAFASADLFVFPSRTDTAGNVVLEAQASGLPVLVSDARRAAGELVRRRSGVVCADPRRGHGRRRRCSPIPTAAGDGRGGPDYALSRSWDAALGAALRHLPARRQSRSIRGAAAKHGRCGGSPESPAVHACRTGYQKPRPSTTRSRW